MYLKRIFIIIIMFAISACDRQEEIPIRKLSVGIVSYGGSEESLQRYNDLKKYLEAQQNSLVELEPAYNEVRALQQIYTNKWDLVFAPPGLAAIAIYQHNYKPLISLEGRDKTRSVFVTDRDFPAENLHDLSGQTIALGQKGSATGYYLPIYNLYGLNFEKVVYAPTPKDVLQQLQDGEVTVGALSLAEYNLFKREFPPNQFKVVYLDKHNVPAGAILISDRLDRNREEQIRKALKDAPSFISATAGYLPTEELPDYTQLTKVIQRVQEVLEESPMVLQ